MDLDIVRPQNNELELAHMAKKLGFKEIIFLYDSFKLKVPQKTITSGLKVRTACIVKSSNEVGVAKNHVDLVFGLPERPFLESKKVDFIIGAENSESSDLLYQKRSGLDDALCGLARENNIGLVFDISACNAVSIGRFAQNAKLARKHSLQFAVATMATIPLDMRSPKDLDGFARTIGLPS